MARERYLVNAGEDTIHANEIKLETTKQKRQNWWFYHKWPLLAIIAVGAIAFSIVYSVVSQVKPDYTIAVLTSYALPDSGKKELERCVAAYADDRNGDGKITVTVANYVFSSVDVASPQQAEEQQAELVKLTADFTMNDSMIFLHDETAFQLMEVNFGGVFQYNDGTAMPETATDFEKAMRPWSDFLAFAGFEPHTEEDDPFTGEILTQLYEKLRVSVRAPEAGSIARSEKAQAYYADSMELYHRLKTGEPLGAGEGE